MNRAAARAARADRRLSGLTAKVPREFKRIWAEMSHKERGRLGRVFRAAQVVRSEVGRDRQASNAAIASATVTTKDIKL